MQIIVELSVFPFTTEYEESILSFIRRLQGHRDIEVQTGETATIVRGEYDLVFEILEKECRELMDGENKVAVVIKMLNLV